MQTVRVGAFCFLIARMARARFDPTAVTAGALGASTSPPASAVALHAGGDAGAPGHRLRRQLQNQKGPAPLVTPR
jgi:hypothetical protein